MESIDYMPKNYPVEDIAKRRSEKLDFQSISIVPKLKQSIQAVNSKFSQYSLSSKLDNMDGRCIFIYKRLFLYQEAGMEGFIPSPDLARGDCPSRSTRLKHGCVPLVSHASIFSNSVRER